MDLGVRLAVGLPRHGKTYGARREVFEWAREHPALVLDTTFEWTRPPGSMVWRELASDTARASSVADAARLFEAGRRLVIVSTDEDPGALGESACKWARYWPGPAAVMLSEAHNAWPVHKPLGVHARVCATAFRHWNVALWIDTQRLSLLNRTFDLAQEIRLYSAPDSDMKRLREIGGASLERAVIECGRRNAPREYGGRGEPGWHVLLREGVRPSRYEPTRAD